MRFGFLFLLLFVVVLSGCSDPAGSPIANPSTTITLPPAIPTITHTPPITVTAISTITDTPIPTFPPTATQPPLPTPLPSPRLIYPTLTPTDAPLVIDLTTPFPTETRPLLPTPSGMYTVRVPILMYHYISVPPEDADIYRIDLSVEPNDFRTQMAYLAGNGFTAIDLYDLSLAITDKKPLPEKPIIITFDDAHLDAYLNAYPILEEFGFIGTFFIITDFIDRGNTDHLTWPMIEEMAANGHRMESHTKTHIDLREQDEDELIWQILGSQETLAAHIGYTPRYFAYPGGTYDDATIDMLIQLDFWGAVTTMFDKWHGFEERYEWGRIRIRHSTPLAVFADYVETP